MLESPQFELKPVDFRALTGGSVSSHLITALFCFLLVLCILCVTNLHRLNKIEDRLIAIQTVQCQKEVQNGKQTINWRRSEADHIRHA